MKRREFIGIAAVGAAGAVVPGAAAEDASVARILAQPRLIDVFHDKRFVRELGQRYLEQAPAEKDIVILVREILGRSPATTATADGPGSGVGLRAEVEDRVQGDFAAGRTVLAGGWILSLTEARQCALFSLLPA